MGAFTFTNSALLGGLAILVAPIIAHLLQRRARKPIVFPSIAFLRSTAAQQSRLHKLRRLFLLFLRALALACIVLAFTRPVWWAFGVTAGELKAATATVFVVDASLSTQQRSGSASLFDRLKADASSRIDELRPGLDRAGVVWAAEQATSVFPRLSANLPELQLELSRATASSARADFAAAIPLAVRLLETHSGPRRLVVLTDRQATNWTSPGNSDAPGPRCPAGVELIIPDLAAGAEPNVALAAPAMQPDRPRPEAPVELSTEVRNHSDAPRVVHVAADWIAGTSTMPAGTQTVSLPAGGATRVTLAAQAPAEPLLAVRWTLREADALAADNQIWIAATSRPGLPLVIASDDSPDTPGAAAFYLSRALAPFDDDSESRSPFLPRHIPASRLSADDLAGVSLVCLAYAGVLKQSTATALAKFVERGGALVVLAGDGPADRNVQLLDEAAQGRLMPWRLLSRKESPRRAPTVLDNGRWNSRWLRQFDEPAQLALREIAFQRVWRASLPAAGAETLLSFNDGSPALGVRHFGRGVCLLLNFSPESTTGDLGKSGTFVALMQILAEQLAGNESRPATDTVGDLLSFTPADAATGEMTITSPDGAQNAVVSPAGSKEIAGGRATLPGVYRLAMNGRPVDQRAVNVDPRESALAPLSISELRNLLEPASPSSTTIAPEVVAAGAPSLAGGRPLWGGFLLAGLAAVALELLLLGIWRR